MTHNVTTPDMETAFDHFLFHYNMETDPHAFWQWLGIQASTSYSPVDEFWHLTEPQFRKVRLLNSPYWITLLKAYEAKYGTQPKTD